MPAGLLSGTFPSSLCALRKPGTLGQGERGPLPPSQPGHPGVLGLAAGESRRNAHLSRGPTPSTNLCVLQSAAVSPAVTTHDVRGSPLAPGGKYV